MGQQSVHRWLVLRTVLLGLVAMGVSSPAEASAQTYEELLWADWPRLPTDAEIEAARQALLTRRSSGVLTDRLPHIVAVEAIKVHAVSASTRRGGQAGTGNHVVAVVTWSTGSRQVQLLYYDRATQRFQLGVAAMAETDSLESWYAAGYEPGWVAPAASDGDPSSTGKVNWRTLGILSALALLIAAMAAFVVAGLATMAAYVITGPAVGTPALLRLAVWLWNAPAIGWLTRLAGAAALRFAHTGIPTLSLAWAKAGECYEGIKDWLAHHKYTSMTPQVSIEPRPRTDFARGPEGWHQWREQFLEK